MPMRVRVSPLAFGTYGTSPRSIGARCYHSATTAVRLSELTTRHASAQSIFASDVTASDFAVLYQRA